MNLTPMSVLMIAGVLVFASGFVTYVKTTDAAAYKTFVAKMFDAFNKTLIALQNETDENLELKGFNINLSKLLNETVNESGETVSALLSKLNLKNSTIVNLTNTITDLTEVIEGYQNGTKYNLHDPSIAELYDFLENNTVDENVYNATYYLCRHFAKDLKNDATALGIRCGYVEVYGPGWQTPADMNESNWSGHVFNVFETTDGQTRYLEPQTDAFIECGYNMNITGIIAKDILVIW